MTNKIATVIVVAVVGVIAWFAIKATKKKWSPSGEDIDSITNLFDELPSTGLHQSTSKPRSERAPEKSPAPSLIDVDYIPPHTWPTA